ncbi:hypothetical protein [Paraburkholderia caballeronis]|uniref:Uncharacterized protein n=1 Tax=Paraburkholderia caballeronis TaxID=416943 RepID=A0A1H7TLC6_9BURK|nr:hypothetical protein [Paraburkholderia caballeronis]PXW18434.1 hypothetical protein C7403_116121 [Paraburkholderia caballeronis]PXW95714.1 hypothetical protein C7407_116121 [Paraburkholderia caballeronis]RAJ92060.1 hypothetical protein C7409_116121 [Paraburkholderia caballeronis]SEB76087.1 hypothetical protein SAMN05445871_1017 [Paraburkholderia caballeronis]SEL85224.1 hypothetical protein SAMN05192542_115121 [Paraburkholderia caballeronis]
MIEFTCNEGTKRAQLDNLTLAYSGAYRRCTDPHARRMGSALRSASSQLWTAGGPENVAASVRAAQLAMLAVQPVKLSCGTNAYLREARSDVNGAIGYEMGDSDELAEDIRPLDEVAEVFWYRGDDKHGRAAIAVLCIIERLLAAEVQ